MTKSEKHSIAFVIYSSDRSRVFTVLRPATDDRLPNVWGLPAGSLRENETFEDAIIRSGHDKLGVELKIIQLINEGSLEREHNILHMKEFEVEISKGNPFVPQNIPGITQYQKWKYANPDVLKEAAQKGSLCSRLYLSSISKTW